SLMLLDLPSYSTPLELRLALEYQGFGRDLPTFVYVAIPFDFTIESRVFLTSDRFDAASSLHWRMSDVSSVQHA
ncbi:MAG TPA: hypothetical protein VMT82_05250, partial [candidate division Zixibacteria bacterium]|nr:hypothetical protein [candidate division Zixibacteria bacterium]